MARPPFVPASADGILRGRWRDCDGTRKVLRASARSRLPRDRFTAHGSILGVAARAAGTAEAGCGGGV